MHRQERGDDHGGRTATLYAEQLRCIRKACRVVATSAGTVTPAEMGAQVGMSPSHLPGALSAVMSSTP